MQLEIQYKLKEKQTLFLLLSILAYDLIDDCLVTVFYTFCLSV